MPGVDRKARLARIWSNQELRKIGPLLKGDVVNVSAGEDIDKEGGNYEEYFPERTSYYRTNFAPGSFRGFQGRENEILLDLTAELPAELKGRFDVAFNHTTLEHIFEVKLAFKNICELSRDVVVLVVPFSQLQHETEDFKDYWRFTPSCLRRLFHDSGMSVIYESANEDINAAIYLFFVAARNPERWTDVMPEFKEISAAGPRIGDAKIFHSESITVGRIGRAAEWIRRLLVSRLPSGKD